MEKRKPAVVELLDDLQQPDVALLHDVLHGHAPPQELCGNADHQFQVAANDLLPGRLIALLQTAEQGHFLFARQDRIASDLLQVDPDPFARGLHTPTPREAKMTLGVSNGRALGAKPKAGSGG